MRPGARRHRRSPDARTGPASRCRVVDGEHGRPFRARERNGARRGRSSSRSIRRIQPAVSAKAPRAETHFGRDPRLLADGSRGRYGKSEVDPLGRRPHLQRDTHRESGERVRGETASRPEARRGRDRGSQDSRATKSSFASMPRWHAGYSMERRMPRSLPLPSRAFSVSTSSRSRPSDTISSYRRSWSTVTPASSDFSTRFRPGPCAASSMPSEATTRRIPESSSRHARFPIFSCLRNPPVNQALYTPPMMTKEKLLLPWLSALLVATLASGQTSLTRGDDRDDRNHRDRTYAVGLWGDVPYSPLQATVGVPNLIADMNSQDLAFSAHNGDLKSGASECTDAVYTQALSYFNSLRAPAIFTPGDNDWTDCDRIAGYSSLAQLEKERALFFSTPFTLGKHRFRQRVQPSLCAWASMARCPASRTAAGLSGRHLRHPQRSGLLQQPLRRRPGRGRVCGPQRGQHRLAARDLRRSRKRRSVAMMLISQANPGFDQSDAGRSPSRDPRTLVQTDGLPDGFQEFLLALRAEVISFVKPVSYVHGDSHYFRLDKPFLDHRACASRISRASRPSATIGERQQRRAVAQGDGRRSQPRSLQLPASNRSRQPRGPHTLSRTAPPLTASIHRPPAGWRRSAGSRR